MALTATIYSFDVQLNDLDRGAYDALAFKAAQHPSESAEYLVARVLAYCLEYREGIAFGRGLAEPDEPAVAITDLAGARQAWIEIGETIEVVALDRGLISTLVARLERRMAFTLMRSEDHLYITLGDETIEGALTRSTLG